MYDIIGYCAAFLTMFGFLPQVIKIYKTKSVSDISIITLIQFFAGILLWLIYGILIKNGAIILANGVTLAILIAGMALYFKYRK